MPIKIQSTANVENKGIKVLVYGAAGTGKTCLCATAPSPIIFSAESGLLSLKRIDLPYITISNFSDLTEAYLWVTTSIEAKKYSTLCLDSISEIAEIVLVDLKEKNKDPRQAFFMVQEKMTDLVKSFRDLPNKHVYLSAKQDRMKDELTGALHFGPSMPGQKLGQVLPYLFDEIFQSMIFEDPATKEKTYALRTRKDSQNEAKDRSGMLEPWETHDLEAIFNKILA